MKTIPGLIAQSLNLTCAVELVLDSGRFCLEVVIPTANDPISFRGIFFFYKDGENHILDDEALDRLMQRDMEADVKWEQRPVVQGAPLFHILGITGYFFAVDHQIVSPLQIGFYAQGL